MESLANSIGLVSNPTTFLFIIVGTLLGILGGATPGVGPTLMLSLLLPFAYQMSTTDTLALFAAVYTGSGFGNGIPATLIRIPGTPSAVLNVVEGYELFLKGQGGRALVVNLFSAVVGQLISVIFFVLLLVPLAAISVYLLQPEVFAMTLLAFVAVAAMISKDLLRGFAAIFFGLLVAMIGADPVSGQARFTLGIPDFYNGLGLAPVLVGLLALGGVFSELSEDLGQIDALRGARKKLGSTWVSLSELLSYWRVIVVGSVTGFIIGIVPGVSASTGAFVAYQQSRLFAKKPEQYGKGSMEAVAAINASDNACFAGDFIPTLALGLPGSASQALVLSVFFIKGMQPGPELMQRQPDLVNAVLGSIIVSTLVLLPLGWSLIKPSVYLASLWPTGVKAVTVALILVSSVALRGQMIDVYITFAFGVFGYLLHRLRIPLAPVAISFMLAETMEMALRRGLLMSHNDFVEFATRPVTAVLLLASLALLLYQIRSTRATRSAGGQGED